MMIINTNAEAYDIKCIYSAEREQEWKQEKVRFTKLSCKNKQKFLF